MRKPVFGQANRSLARLYRDGISAFDRGDFLDAAQLLSQVQADSGVYGTFGRYYLGQAHLHAGLSLMHSGRHAEAGEHLRAAQHLNPSSADVCEYLAQCYACQTRYDQAIQVLQQAPADAKKRGAVAIRLALAHWRNAEPELAMATLQAAIRVDPLDAEPHYQLGLMRAATDDLQVAIDLLQTTIDIRPDHAEAHRHLGLVLAAAGQVDRAAHALQTAHRLRPRDAGLALELSLALQCCPGHAWPDAAVTEVLAARRPDPDRQVPLLEVLGQRLTSEPELVEAFLDLPPTPRDWEIFGVLAGAVRLALHRVPHYADLHHYAACVHARLGRTQDAVKAEEQALSINPRYVQALIHLARLFVGMKRYDDAVGRFETAIRHGGDYADVHFELGELHRAAGRIDPARAAYRRALDLNQDYTEAQHALSAVAAA